MKYLLFIMTTITVLANPGPQTIPDQVAKRITVRAEFDHNYLLTLPAGYEADSGKRWPLLVFLHGSGERGADLERVRKQGLPKYIDAGHALPFIVVAPQCPDDEWWNLPAIEAFVAAMVRTYRVDPERIYLTGLSMGGFGVWALAARHPERYAAVIPICGGGETKWAARLRDLPVWAFHGVRDTAVPVVRSQEMVDAIRAAGGSPRLTLYPEAGHDAWTETYANDEIYTWLRSHRRRK